MAVAGTLTYKTELDTTGVKKAGNTIKSIVAGLGVTKMITTAMNTIKNSTDDAIKRLDTLNNFPKVMENLGISAEDSSNAIKKMSDKLSGLPTTLDQGARAVQRFTSKNGDVKKSTDIFLALNNAILAGGASTEIQASALEQMSQAYAKGKPDMMEWRTLLTAMPAQLNQVAEAMGYGKNGANELGEALRKGDVSMDTFMNTIVELNTKGGKNFKSFEKQAKASTSGIATSITVAKTQIVKGVTDIISALNEKFEDTKFGSLTEFIASIGNKSKEELQKIASFIKGEISFEDFVGMGIETIIKYMQGLNEKLPDLLNQVGKMIIDMLNIFIAEMPEFINQGIDIVVNLINGISDQLPTLIPVIVELILVIVEALLDNLDKIVDAGINLILALIDGTIEALPILLDHAPTIIDKLVMVIIDNLPKIVKTGVLLIEKLIEGIIKQLPKLITDTIPKIIVSIYNAIIKGFSQIFDAGKKLANKFIDGLKSGLSVVVSIAYRVITDLVNEFLGNVSKLESVGRNLISGLWNGVKNKWNSLKGDVKKFGNSVVSQFQSVFKIGSPSKIMADQVGKFLAEGIALGIDDNTDSIEKSMNDMYKEMNRTIQMENAKMNFDVYSNNAYNKSLQLPALIDLNANFEGVVPVQLNLDGEKIYDNQQKISLRKSIQYGGGK